MEATTDREWLIKIDGKIERTDAKLDNMCEAVERLANAIDKFETEKYEDHEKRLRSLEDERNERKGMYRLFIIVTVILTTLAAIGVFKMMQR